MDRLHLREKELQAYLNCLDTDCGFHMLKEKTIIMWHSDNPNWFRNRTTKDDLLYFLINPINHKVDGIKWNNGFLGSRWADTILNNKEVRIAFYSKNNI